MNQKGFVNIALTVLVVLAVGVVGYFALQKSPTVVTPPTAMQQTTTTDQTLPISSPSTTKNVSLQSQAPTKTADWKAYCRCILLAGSEQLQM